MLFRFGRARRLAASKVARLQIIMFGGGLGVFKDMREPDPSRRFKIAGGAPGWSAPGIPGGASCGILAGGDDLADGSGECAIATGASPDGISGWKEIQPLNYAQPPRQPVAICPGSPSKLDCLGNLFFDSRLGEYILTTRRETAAGRSIAIARGSGGQFNFTMPVETVEMGVQQHQLYFQVTFPYFNVYLGVVMVYDALSGTVGAHAGHVHCKLVWSADLTSWRWVDESDLIPAGPPGSFDSHVCFASSPIVAPDGSIRIYCAFARRCSASVVADACPAAFVALHAPPPRGRHGWERSSLWAAKRELWPRDSRRRSLRRPARHGQSDNRRAHSDRHAAGCDRRHPRGRWLCDGGANGAGQRGRRSDASDRKLHRSRGNAGLDGGRADEVGDHSQGLHDLHAWLLVATQGRSGQRVNPGAKYMYVQDLLAYVALRRVQGCTAL